MAQVAAVVTRLIDVGEGNFEHRKVVFIFQDKDTIEYMLRATGARNVGDLRLTKIADDEDYHE